MELQPERFAMTRTLAISDNLHTQLETAAREQGFRGIEQLLEAWQERYSELRRRREVVDRINARRARLFASHGEMPDSTELIREDRGR